MRTKPLALAFIAFAMVFCCFTASAQDGEAVILDGQDGLMPGGGDDGGGQFPQGTDECSGDRNHHAHDYPSNPCSRVFNRHYSAYDGSGKPCNQRSRNCGACENCCNLQTTEAQECYCFTDSCDALADYARTTCMGVCISHYEGDGCDGQ
jgi:hypothetical protein